MKYFRFRTRIWLVFNRRNRVKIYLLLLLLHAYKTFMQKSVEGKSKVRVYIPSSCDISTKRTAIYVLERKDENRKWASLLCTNCYDRWLWIWDLNVKLCYCILGTCPIFSLHIIRLLSSEPCQSKRLSIPFLRACWMLAVTRINCIYFQNDIEAVKLGEAQSG